MAECRRIQINTIVENIKKILNPTTGKNNQGHMQSCFRIQTQNILIHVMSMADMSNPM